MATLVDFQATVPSGISGAGVLPFGVAVPAPIPTAPNQLVLAQLGVTVAGAQNRIELKATVGIATAAAAADNITFTVLRDGVGIVEVALEDEAVTSNDVVSIIAADFNASPGFHVYQLVVNTPAATAGLVVNGPVTFTATSYSL